MGFLASQHRFKKVPPHCHALDTRNPRGVTPAHNCPLSAASLQSRNPSTQMTRASSRVTPTTIPVMLWSSGGLIGTSVFVSPDGGQTYGDGRCDDRDPGGVVVIHRLPGGRTQ